ncbi:MAG: NUDIX domain-containing protein, partial [Planctomycetes bacterium]|nr:NUDIX domain-containing protein [Planctomycetota bacterium]
LPRLQAPAAPKLEQRVVAALLSGNKILVQRRPRGGRWSGLWELPNAPGGRSDAAGVLGELCAALSLPPRTAPLYTATVSHRLTHRLYRFHVYRICLAPGVRRRGGTSRRWIALGHLPELPLSTVQRRILHGLAATD